MAHFFKSSTFLLVCFCVTFFAGDFGVRRVYAIDTSGNGAVNLTDFVTPLTAISQAGFSISSGEVIKYAAVPGDVSGTVRMYKNTNWEQFVTDGSWIRRREDTSWAPQGDVHCNDTGSRAVYTLTSDAPPGGGLQVPGSAGWLPTSVNFAAFKASQGSSSMAIVPIDMTKVASSNGMQRIQCPLKENIGSYPATGQSQAMELTYHPAGTFAFCSGAKNAEDLIDVLVTNGFGTGDRFYFMKGWGFVGFQDPTGRNAGLGSGGTCGGGGGFSPGPYNEVPPVEPGCSGGQNELTIKGTIKSKNIYLYGGVDPVTGHPIYSRYTTGQKTDAPMVNNLPVYHATIQVHNSVRETSQVTVAGNAGTKSSGGEKTVTHDYNSGLLDGMLAKSYASVQSNADGTFVITAKSSCKDVYRSDWKGTGYEQFLSVSCPDQPAGKPKGLYAKDNYGMILNLPPGAEGGVINQDIQVDCDYDPEAKYGVFAANDNLKLMNRNRDVYMACSGVRQIGNTYTSDNWNTGVKFDDTKNWPDINIRSSVEAIIKGLFNNWLKEIGITVPFGQMTGAQTENRTQIQNQDFSLDQMSTAIAMQTGGIKGGDVVRANFYRDSALVPAGVTTYPGGQEGKSKVYTCEEIKRCNLGIGEDGYPNENAQTCGGYAFGLAAPNAGIVRDSTGKILLELSQYLPRWLETTKTEDDLTNKGICTDVNGNFVQIADIMPPEGYCGEVNGIPGIQMGIEMPCPQVFTCGPGEVDCSTVLVQNLNGDGGYDKDHIYKYDVSYFPYFAIFSPTTQPLANSVTWRTYIQDDAYHAMCPRGYNSNEDYIPGNYTANTSKPMNTAACPYGLGSDTFYPEEEVKYPGYRDYGTNYTTTYNLSTTALKSYSLPFQSVGTPQFVSSTTPAEVVGKTIAGMKATLSATRNANFFRIGVPDNLCSCSLVEYTGSSRLGNCGTVGGDDGGAPAPKEPSNMFNDARDEPSGSGDRSGDNYQERQDSIKNPYLGTLPTGASRTAGSGDYTWTNIFEGAARWVHGGPAGTTTTSAATDVHYSQPIESKLDQALTTVGEYVACSGSGKVDIPILDKIGKLLGLRDEGNINCERVVKILTENKFVTGWDLPRIDSAPMVFNESLFPPEVQMSHELPSSVALGNATSTKLQETVAATDPKDMPGYQGSGYAQPRGTDFVAWDNLLQSMVSQPTFAIEPSAAAPPAGPPGSSGPPGSYCNAGCTACWSLQISADSGGFTLTNPGQGTWGDIHIQWKNKTNGNRYNVPQGGTKRVDDPGCGDWEWDSNPQGCQDQARPGGNVAC